MRDDEVGVGDILGVLAFIVMIIVGIMFAYPQYSVYSSRLAGEAKLAEAEYSRQITVREAQAHKDSAVMLAEAEVLRADGVARANKIIGDSLHGNEVYLRYLWINKLDASQQNVIYIPTETGMPIMEAGRSVK